MAKTPVNLRMDENITREMDKYCKKWAITRTEFIEESVKDVLERRPIEISKKRRVTMF